MDFFPEEKNSEKSERIQEDKDFIATEVQEGYSPDRGRAIVRISVISMKELGVSPGDIIEIEGKRVTVAKCFPLYPSDEKKGIVRMDDVICNNSCSSIGDVISIRKITVVPAEQVLVQELEEIPFFDGRYLSYVLENIPLIKDDNIVVPYYDDYLKFQVIKTTPSKNAVFVTNKTIFNIKDHDNFQNLTNTRNEIMKVLFNTLMNSQKKIQI